MKRILFICVFFSGLAAVAQGPQVVLPWMPTRDTNHIRIVRQYGYDKVTQERKLLSTEQYDRHGYRVDANHIPTYNKQGLLTRYVELREKKSTPDDDTASVWNVSYSPDGVIQHINVVMKDYGFATVYTYDLITHKSHPVYGLLDYTFKWCRTNGENVYCDTVYYRREFDDKGNLLRESRRFDDAVDYITYHYRDDGRVDYRVGEYYEFADSLAYHYDDHGVLTHKTGKLYDLGMEADVFIRCQPDGRKIEERQVWHVYEDDSESTEINEFDSHGVFLRMFIDGRKIPDWDYEVDYWE